ncbi:DNA-binding CsgD family transcriptional regulator [Okibacterium sp. HSC-33S16]|uniref:AAA family ATPase n=1 Tax=Okibacterium sp. HSC-33S16 TaxID=2910965 RepID=UPI00209D52A4|nr:LuxR family transcriptional regulator [Okibacterium sp. HSC-33S16]MCP2031248.1 DNA-binding CsgD family transcriptional regulator [Okibacterium sp. HSC-33S16]
MNHSLAYGESPMMNEPLPHAAAPHSSVLYGRARQLAAIADAAMAVEDHKAQFVLIEGESGFGKTALLHRALDQLPDWPRNLATADAYERSLPYGVLNQLLAPFDQSLLSPVLANGVDPAAPTLAVGAELLALVDASEGATIIAIDDAQWVDEQSARALWFAGRRSLHDRLLILIAARPTSTDFLSHIRRLVVDGERGVRLEVGGLSAEDVNELAASRFGRRLRRHAAQRLVAATDGNALHLRAILEYVAATPDPVVELERRMGDGVLPLAPGFDSIMAESMERLTESARTVIHLAAVIDDRVPLHLLSAAAARLLGTDAVEDAIDEAVRSRLIDTEDSGGQIELRLHHHRIRDAVLAELPVRQRRELHRAVAQVVSGDRQLRHRVHGAFGPDNALAEELDREAQEALWHHEAERAVRYSMWAASLSSSPVEQQRRLVVAGLSAITTRRLGLLVGAIPEFANLPAGVERDLLMGCAALAGDDVDLARVTLTRAATTKPEDVWGRAMVALANEALATLEIEARRFDVVTRASETAIAEIAKVRSDPGYDPAALGVVDLTELAGTAVTWRTMARWKSAGDLDVDLEISGLLDRAAQTGFTPQHAVMLVTRGAIRRQQGRLDEAIADLDHGISLADIMRPSIAPYGRIELALAHFRQGRWDESATTAAIAVALADDFGGSGTYGLSQAVAALVPAARGQKAVAESHLAEATRSRPPVDPTLLLLVDAVSARAEGDYATVARIAQDALSTEHPRAQIGANWWTELLDEATRPLSPGSPASRDPLSALSVREREVAHLAAQGLTNREVAQRLFVTVKGVEYHMGNVLAKLHLTSRRGIRALIDGQANLPTAGKGNARTTRDAP